MPAQRRWLWPGVLAVVLGVAAAGCGGSSPSSAGTTTTTARATTTTTAPTTTTTTVPATTTTTVKSLDGTSSTSPLPLGQTATLDGWKIKLVSLTQIDKDAIDETPPAGFAFMEYKIEYTRTAAEPEAPYLLVRLLGPSAVERSAATEPLCLAGSAATETVHQGGTVTDGGCISVPTGDVGHLVLSVGDFTDQVWFATS